MSCARLLVMALAGAVTALSAPAVAFGVRGDAIPPYVEPAPPATVAAPRVVMFADIPNRPVETPVIVPGSPFSDPALRGTGGAPSPEVIRRYLGSLATRAGTAF